MPADGGVPKRLTYTATLDRDDVSDRMGPNNIVMTWRDDKTIVFRSRQLVDQRLPRRALHHFDRRRDAGAASAATRRLVFLLARRKATGLQPRLPRVSHVEAIPRRHGRRHLAL